MSFIVTFAVVAAVAVVSFVAVVRAGGAIADRFDSTAKSKQKLGLNCNNRAGAGQGPPLGDGSCDSAST